MDDLKENWVANFDAKEWEARVNFIYCNYGKYIVYIITNKINEKIYIGKTHDIRKRFSGYKNCKNSKTRSLIYNSIKKYGIGNFKVEILEHYDLISDSEFLIDREEYWILKCGSLSREIGYNVLLRGFDRTGTKASEETKKKMSESRKGKVNLNCCLRVDQIDPITKNILRTFDSINDAARFIGQPNAGGNITKVCKREKNNILVGDFMWSYTDIPSGPIQEVTPRAKKIVQIDKNTKEIIKVWKNAEEAAFSLCGQEKAADNIRRVCSNSSRFKTSLGFYWEYEREPFEKSIPYNSKKKKVKQIDLKTGEIIKIWDSATEASLSICGKFCGGISKVCTQYKRKDKNIIKSALGFGWEFYND